MNILFLFKKSDWFNILQAKKGWKKIIPAEDKSNHYTYITNKASYNYLSTNGSLFINNGR
ncbi:hypothetical protein C2I17_19075 [Niallia circulans]|uniref:hypothetical protein n=1 Tax=Niallia circulans TaxID=1397 RepID=UPI00201E53B7|nr:hypothetical protein [Niallia circulans]UQZ76471.1 hypothetical protein C2I17_19075 [Niallia circulans]